MSSHTTTIECQKDGPVARVWLQRPELRNAFNEHVIADLQKVFADLSAEPDLRAVVLGARGSVFCAGADLNWMREMASYDWEANQADAMALARMLHTIWSCPVPVIARVHGDCYAGGMGLVAACDVRVGADSAGFCLSEARLGLLPATIGPYVIRAMGVSAAQRYFVSAERFDASQAVAMGFLQEAVPVDQIDEAVERVLNSLLANGPQAVRACKKLVRDLAQAPLNEDLIRDTARRIADVRSSPEGREGVSSFLEKRRPSWTAFN